ncbi:MAG: signal recognition particle-docking protein FtsY [Candidatus Aminicenantes bacterium]|nr:MAG: signal recognition particle-docking protein FtsY [Candidatus Aminicenantes bacterium]
MKLNNLFKGSLKRKLDAVLSSKKSREEIFEEVEEQLVLADISLELVEEILANVRKTSKLSFEKEDFFQVLKEEIKRIFAAIGTSPGRPRVDTLLPVDQLKIPGKKTEETTKDEKVIIMLVGVNGSGKTTTAAKLAYHYQQQGKNVLMSAADTFRAAGSSQLSLWGERLDIPVIGGERGADPGSVVYNSVNSLMSKDYDVLIIDTAGRVQTRENFMKELEKLSKIVKKFIPSGPTDTLLVIDATMGQNTLDQAKKFKTFSGINGMILAKVDGTAKGGTVINIINEMRIPVKYVGTGETEKDLAPFSVDEFIDSLLSDQ